MNDNHNKRSQRHAGHTAQERVLGNEISQRRTTTIIKCDKGPSWGVGQQVMVSEMPQLLHLWMEITAVSGGGDETAATTGTAGSLWQWSAWFGYS